MKDVSLRCRHRGFAEAALLAGAFALGCDGLLQVELPTQVPIEALDDPRQAATLVHSAIADFECAFVNYVDLTALLTDELYASAAGSGVVFPDRRVLASNGAWTTASCTSAAIPFYQHGVYTPLAIARFQADDAFRRIESFPDDQVAGKETLLATAAAYAGYSYTLLGEGFCEAVFDAGPLLQPSLVLAIAEQRFTTAIELAETVDTIPDILRMARLGRARVRLNLGKKSEAAADAALILIPVNFVKHATYSAGNARRENIVWRLNDLGVTSVDPRFRNLLVDGVPDSRVRVTDTHRAGNDGSTPLWLQTKYTSAASPIVLASWKEAQLIIAEATGGQVAVDAINRLRLRAGLPTFASTDPAVITEQVVEERRRELFLEGHRLNDMLRLGLPFDSTFTHKGAPYGTTKCLPLPAFELR